MLRAAPWRAARRGKERMANPIYPMIGYGMGTLPQNQNFVDVQFARPPVRPESEAEVLRVRMPREQTRSLAAPYWR